MFLRAIHLPAISVGRQVRRGASPRRVKLHRLVSSCRRPMPGPASCTAVSTRPIRGQHVTMLGQLDGQPLAARAKESHRRGRGPPSGSINCQTAVIPHLARRHNSGRRTSPRIHPETANTADDPVLRASNDRTEGTCFSTIRRVGARLSHGGFAISELQQTRGRPTCSRLA